MPEVKKPTGSHTSNMEDQLNLSGQVTLSMHCADRAATISPCATVAIRG